MKSLSVTVIQNIESYSAEEDFIVFFKNPNTQKIIRVYGYSPADAIGKALLSVWKYGYTIDTIKTRGQGAPAYMTKYLGK